MSDVLSVQPDNLEATVEALVDKELATRLWSVADSLRADTVAAC